MNDKEVLWRDIMPLEWNQEKYTTGFTAIDEQHYQLFDGLNSLLVFLKDSSNIEQPEEQEKAMELINFLGEYAVNHFRDEEELFEKSQHPMKDINKEEHQRFVAKYLEYKNKLTAGTITRGTLIQLHIFLQSWLVKHISKIDTSLRECVVQEAAESDFTKKQSVFARFLSLFQKKQLAA
ncbi:MAG: hemerythrin-like metal-binding domain protein [Candidatus Electronema aureum]|uniref:Hemerythrin-like metal-binding domain protein n=1 Tax=Candidatus Electronema aureum TaxID=2005002 RepID=A0A521FZL4_9BACT|nr:MAG: hemerythrin-like metal-binding domain protein [Candidatus Electronema aureum]